LVRHFRTDRLTIRCDRPSPINLDGELRTAQVVELSVAKEKLRFFYPKGLTWQAAETATV
jgi:diacylglycerol kinase family enzyme